MRLRIRGPAGQSPVTLPDDATVKDLRRVITTATSLSSFSIKYGYPPKELALDQYGPSTRVADLDVKLNGEQLIVSTAESTGQNVTEKLSPAADDTASKSRPLSLQAAPDSQFSWTGSTGSSAPPVPTATKPNPTAGSSSNPEPPLSLSRKANPAMSDPPEIILPDLAGTLLLRIMPDDNSCLFRAVASAVMPGIDTMTELRSFVAQTIQANPDKYSAVVLDNKAPDDYCRWIQTEDAWGGQIELEILAHQFGTEICSIDVQTLRVDHYNEDATTRCIVVYSGIHYDTIALSPFEMPPEEDIKMFEAATKDEVLAQAVILCQKLQERHYFTDTASFKIKCNVCGALCTGERGATEHAAKTGHYDFGESS